MKGTRIATYILFVGIAVSFFAFLDGAALYQNYLTALYEINDYSYRETYMISITDSGHAEEIVDALMECPGIAYLDDTLVYVDDSEKYNGSFLKMLVQNEPLIYPVLEGTIPESVPMKRQVVLGLNLEEYCEEKADGRYIMLDGEEYAVTGIIGGRSDVLYAFDIMYDPDCRQECIDLLNSTGYIYVMLVSNKGELEDFVLEFAGQVQNLSEESYLYYEKAEQATEYMDAGMTDRDFYLLICIFSIVNCIIISEFWIIRRKQEIVIRKIWGFNNLRLMGILYTDLLKISMLAIVAVWLLQFFLVYVLHSDTGIRFDIGKLLQSIVFILVMSLVIVLLPVYKAATEMPCVNLEV